jgi:hypothetical protein
MYVCGIFQRDRYRLRIYLHRLPSVIYYSSVVPVIASSSPAPVVRYSVLSSFPLRSVPPNSLKSFKKLLLESLGLQSHILHQ